MKLLPLEVWEELWAGLEGGLQEPLSLPDLRWLARQGRWACEFSRRDEGPQLFDLQVWARDLNQRHDLQLQWAEGLPTLRRGRPQALEYLLLALGWRGFAPLRIGGDDAELTFEAAGTVDEESLRGPLLAYLLAQLGARLDDGRLLRCPCPAQQSGVPVDLEALNRSCMDDAEFERELIETFTAEGRRQLASLAFNYSSHTLHSLKGSAAMVGA
ncbi:MAG: hypothetical protein KIS61_33125, partial [Candidatus Eremiobacteraeota bacterium]|nr:hypothetical protein [Candidatus Eremiobacteraeota bacterium]